MTQPWVAERVVDPDLARALVDAQFSDLRPVHAEPFGVGFDNTAYLVNREWVFRFPRRIAAVPWLLREVRALPLLARRLPAPVPVPERIGEPSESYPWPFAGYRLLAGRTGCCFALSDAERAALAEPLARFVAALHAISATEAAAFCTLGDELGKLDVAARTPIARAQLAELVERGLLAADARQRLEQIVAATPVDAQRPAAVVVHGDLYVRHLLLDEQRRLAGVIDWGDVHLGDRALDLAAASLTLPPHAHAAFRAAYGAIDEATWQLARFRAVFHAAACVRYAADVNDEDLGREGRQALAWMAA